MTLGEINDTSRAVRTMIISDAPSCGVILTTPEVSFMIIIFLFELVFLKLIPLKPVVQIFFTPVPLQAVVLATVSNFNPSLTFVNSTLVGRP